MDRVLSSTPCLSLLTSCLASSNAPVSLLNLMVTLRSWSGMDRAPYVDGLHVLICDFVSLLDVQVSSQVLMRLDGVADHEHTQIITQDFSAIFLVLILRQLRFEGFYLLVNFDKLLKHCFARSKSY